MGTCDLRAWPPRDFHPHQIKQKTSESGLNLLQISWKMHKASTVVPVLSDSGTSSLLVLYCIFLIYADESIKNWHFDTPALLFAGKGGERKKRRLNFLLLFFLLKGNPTCIMWMWAPSDSAAEWKKDLRPCHCFFKNAGRLLTPLLSWRLTNLNCTCGTRGEIHHCVRRLLIARKHTDYGSI